MPSSSTISSSDKSKVKSSLPSSSNKIITATVARVFVAYPNKSSWSYTGVEGALAFVRDLDRGTFVLKVVDLRESKGILWEHELYEPLSYQQDRTFFHTLEGDEHLIGFAFADDGEASELYKKISNRQKFAKGSSSSKKSKRGSKLLGGGSVKGKIDKSMISSPSDFKHVAHMGYTAEKGFSAENVDPSWSALLDQLTNMGISHADIQKNERFIKDFVGQRGGVPPPRTTAPAGGATKAKKVPPPAPSRAGTTARKQPPPPPAPRIRPGAASSPVAPPPPPSRAPGSAAAAAAGAIQPPPPPPIRGANAHAAAPPPPPPPPARGAGAAPPPPPPPPPPMSGAAGGAPPPPPPPPPAAAGSMPPPQSGRAELMASIQGQGVQNLRKVDHSAAAAAAGAGAGVAAGAGAAYAATGTPDETGGGDSGADLASALAAALSQRKENMGDSDEEGESEEEW